MTFPAERFVWFALKDPRILRKTVLWISNGGRHYPPWNGRHINVMGLEEVTAYFHLGLADSARKNPICDTRLPDLPASERKKAPGGALHHGRGHHPGGIRSGSLDPAAPGNQAILLQSASGRQARAAVHLDFLQPDAT